MERALSTDICREAGRARVRAIAAGKAAPGMAVAASRVLGAAVRSGLVIAPFEAQIPERHVGILGGHPVPSPGSEEGGRRALELARTLQDDELLLVLLSGGASAVMAVPADGLTLDDKRRVTSELLRRGADIHALNTVRKHLSAIKGGQLAATAAGPSITFAISDVVGDEVSVIGSGPTVADPSSFSDALAILQRYGGTDTYPQAVVERFSAGARHELPDTPVAGDLRLAHASTRVIGGRADAMRGAEQKAVRLGYTVIRVDAAIVGDARRAALAHVEAVLPGVRRVGRPACVVSSGETTVVVKGAGKGGRNQEFALAGAEALAESQLTGALASVGTDGIDGPTDAAGAIGDSTTLDRMRSGGLREPAHYFAENNTYEAFSRLGDLIHTGPTGTNVGDLQILLIG